MIDLGAWASEQYRLAVKSGDDDAEGGSTEPERDAP